MTRQLTTKQVGALRSLHFWYRNMQMAISHADLQEYKKSRDAINFIYRDCDRLNITFKIQNRVTSAAEENLPFSEIDL